MTQKDSGEELGIFIVSIWCEMSGTRTSLR